MTTDVPDRASFPPAVPPALDPAAAAGPNAECDLDALASRIVGLAGRLAAATCHWLLLVARFDAADGASAFTLPSTARWLAHACGLAHRTAIEHVRVARALAQFPALAREMSAGALSYSQVRAISRVPNGDDPAVVDDLIEFARHGSASQLETVVRGLRTIDDNESGAPLPEDKYVTSGWTTESQWRCSARLAAEDGAVVDSAVDLIARSGGITRPQALVRMAELAIAALTDVSRPPRGLRGHERAAVVIHLDASAVPARTASPADDPRSAERGQQHRANCVEPGPEEPAELRFAERAADAMAPSRGPTPPTTARPRPFARIERGPGLPARVVERLLCSGRLRTAVHDSSGATCDLGRSRRVVSERLYRALLERDDGACTFPGCPTRQDLEAHHVRHWLYGGRTDLRNLVLLCRAHHHAHHEGAFSIAPPNATTTAPDASTTNGPAALTPTAVDGTHGCRSTRFRFIRADGRELVATIDRARFATASPGLERHCAHVDPVPDVHLRPADRLDRRYAVAVLARPHRTARPEAQGGDSDVR